MQRIAVVLVFLLSVGFARANEIDNLKTRDDVQKFLVKKVNPKWKTYIFFEKTSSRDTSTFGKGRFLRLDLDNNGLTDLLIDGKYFLAVTDSGNGYYAAHLLDKGFLRPDRHTLKNIIYKDKMPLLIISGYGNYHPEEEIFTASGHSEYHSKETTETDTLVLRLGELYKYNPSPDNFKIQEINFSSSSCFGTCPVFTLAINADRTARYDAKEFSARSGSFKAIIDSISFANLLATINYIKITSLKDNYSINWTDYPTAILEIKFSDGRVKKITDYGESGTIELEYLYKQFFALQNTQNWQ